MANPHRGQVSFESEGKSYTLSFSANALCELEDQMNLGINEILSRLGQVEKLRIKTVRSIFWAGLTDHHSGITVKEAGELITEITMVKAIELIGKTMELALPQSEEGGEAHPPKPDRANGTGLSS